MAVERSLETAVGGIPKLNFAGPIEQALPADAGQSAIRRRESHGGNPVGEMADRRGWVRRGGNRGSDGSEGRGKQQERANGLATEHGVVLMMLELGVEWC